jgi:TorA maturation chaperone TorD
MNREEHLQWCKIRALEYVDSDDIQNAWASMASDMQKHEETKDHIAINLGMSLMMIGQLSTPQEMRKFIEDFN